MGTYKIILNSLVLAWLSLYALSANALALSDAQLKSHLNQTLDVRIELIVGDASELDDLRIQLGQIAENNVNRYHLKYEVLKGDNGNFLKITTSDAIREPIIEFALDIGWSDGQVIREYSLLIDPAQN